MLPLQIAYLLVLQKYMPAKITIRGKVFDVCDITNLSTDWDVESKVQHLFVTLSDGQSFDFIEDYVQGPWDGELYAANRIYKKLLAG